MTISLLEHPLGAQPGQPGDRSAFHFETITRLPSTASGLGRDGARYGRTGIIHTPHGDIRTPAFVPVGTQAAMKADFLFREHLLALQGAVRAVNSEYQGPSFNAIPPFLQPAYLTGSPLKRK